MASKIESRSAAGTVRIVTLASQIECKTGQSRLTHRFAERLEVRRRPA